MFGVTSYVAHMQKRENINDINDCISSASIAKKPTIHNVDTQCMCVRVRMCRSARTRQKNFNLLLFFHKGWTFPRFAFSLLFIFFAQHFSSIRFDRMCLVCLFRAHTPGRLRTFISGWSWCHCDSAECMPPMAFLLLYAYQMRMNNVWSHNFERLCVRVDGYDGKC